MKAQIVIIITALLVILLAGNAMAAPILKKTNEDGTYWSMIKEKKFHFKVVNLLTGSSDRTLSDNSMLSVNDTMFACYLPNYTGLDFTSSSFNYNIQFKKRECLVSLQNTIANSDQFLLSIAKDGYGTLKVIHPDGSGIIFRGMIMNE